MVVRCEPDGTADGESFFAGTKILGRRFRLERYGLVVVLALLAKVGRAELDNE